MTQPGRVFATILKPSPAVIAAHGLVLIWAGYLGWTSPVEMRAVYVVLLLFQSFSAATGFVFRARRGHFDQVLVAPASRIHVAFAHAGGGGGGGGGWGGVGSGIEGISNRGSVPLGLTLPAVSALLYMSAIAW